MSRLRAARQVRIFQSGNQNRGAMNKLVLLISRGCRCLRPGHRYCRHVPVERWGQAPGADRGDVWAHGNRARSGDHRYGRRRDPARRISSGVRKRSGICLFWRCVRFSARHQRRPGPVRGNRAENANPLPGEQHDDGSRVRPMPNVRGCALGDQLVIRGGVLPSAIALLAGGYARLRALIFGSCLRGEEAPTDYLAGQVCAQSRNASVQVC